MLYAAATSDYLWNGEFRDTLGARVNADGPIRYSVFVASSGKRAVVLVNESSDKAITAKVILPHAGKLVACSPEHPDSQSTDGTLNIPPRSAAVVME